MRVAVPTLCVRHRELMEVTCVASESHRVAGKVTVEVKVCKSVSLFAPPSVCPPPNRRLRHSIWIQRDAKSFIYGYLQMIIACLFTTSVFMLCTYSILGIYQWYMHVCVCVDVIACCVTEATRTSVNCGIFNLLRKSHTTLRMTCQYYC